jgi:hypothetical protein
MMLLRRRRLYAVLAFVMLATPPIGFSVQDAAAK